MDVLTDGSGTTDGNARRRRGQVQALAVREAARDSFAEAEDGATPDSGTAGSASAGSRSRDTETEELADEIVRRAAHMHAYKRDYLKLVAEFDRRRGWEPSGHRSCADWLAFHTGCDGNTAREHVRVARALEELPRTGEAMAEGRLSFSQARALTRVATPEEEEAYAKILHCLKEGNQKWAGTAPLLGLAIVKKEFSKNGKPNRHAMHDLGLAMGNLTVQATDDGLFVHQMAGILVDKIREEYGISEDYEVGHGFAIGYLGDVEQLPEDLQESEAKPQKRKPLSEIVFRGEWRAD